jgi:hypothetical protein
MEDNLLSTIYAGNTEELRVYEWRIAQLHQLGLPRLIAEALAAVVDWHQVADLVRRGCPPLLAVEIVR